MNVEVLTDLHAALAAAGDTSATRTVYGVIIALGVIGLALLVLAIWLIKQTKPEPQLLAPLERMDDRAWRKQEPAQMRRDLDSLRPPGARPVVREKGVPDIDADFAQSRPTLGNFDDLRAQLADDARHATASTPGKPTPSAGTATTRTGGGDPLLAGVARRDAAGADEDRADEDRAADSNAAGDGT